MEEVVDILNEECSAYKNKTKWTTKNVCRNYCYYNHDRWDKTNPEVLQLYLCGTCKKNKEKFIDANGNIKGLLTPLIMQPCE